MHPRRWFVAFAAFATVLAVLLVSRTTDPAPVVPTEEVMGHGGAVLASTAELQSSPAAVPAGEMARTAATAADECTVVCEVTRGDMDPFPGAAVSVEIGTAGAELRTADERGLVPVVVRGAAPAKVTFAAGAAELVGRPAVGYSGPGSPAPKVQLRLRARDVLVRGVVMDMQGQPLANARVSWSRDEPATRCDAAGRFEVRVPSRSTDFRCLFLAPGFRSHRENVMLSLGVPVDLQVRLQPGPRVRGCVVDGEGRAVVGAVVETILQRISGQPAVSDVEGRYEIDCIMDPGSDVQVAVRSPGFVPTSARVSTVNGDATCDFTLQPAGIVRGTVRCPDGRPAAGAGVSTTGDRMFGSSQESTTTDEHGHFVLDEVAPGSVGLRASCTGFPPASASAAVVVGKPVDVTITLAAGATARGVVVDGDGRPVRGAHVMHASANTRTDGGGRFELTGLPAGPALVADVMSPDCVVRRDVALSTSVDNRIELARAGTLRGMVVDARTGAGLDDFTIRIVGGDFPKASIGVTWAREGQRFQRTAGRWQGDEMMFTPGSEWRVRITAPGYAAVVHTCVAKLEHLLVDEVEMTTGANVTGRLVTPFPASSAGNAEVRLLDRAPGESRSERYEPGVRSRADGVFTFAAVAPGQVWLAITAAGMPPQTLGPFSVGATDCDLGDLAIGDGGTIVGTLFDDEGRPASDCALLVQSVHADTTSPRRFEARTGPDGTFTLTGLTSGTWRLAASIRKANDGVTIAIDCRLTFAGGEIRLDLRPSGGCTVRGQVRGTWGKDALPTVIVRRGNGRDPTTDFMTSASSRDGKFAIGGLAPGSYDVSVMLPPRSARTTVTVDQDIEPAPIVLDLGKQ